MAMEKVLVKKDINIFMVSPYIQIKSTSDRLKLHTFLRVHIHVSDYKI